MARKVAKLREVKSKKSPVTIPNKHLLDAYNEMVRSRLLDEKTITLYKQNKCHFQIGCAGHEAVQIAASRVFKAGKDWFYPYYREMALCAGLGMTDQEFMLNAMNKEDDPNSHGRQMPMHYGHKDLNIVQQSSPTGTQFLQAVGMAKAIKLERKKDIVYVSAGEGTCSQGDFHEALNWAAREKLPVIFVIQNNKYAISVPVEEQLAGGSVHAISAGYENLRRYEIDGTDYIESYDTIKEAYQRAKKGQGPAIIEAHVPRLQSHSISDNHKKYRSEQDIEAEKKRCPIFLLKKYLTRNKISTTQKLSAAQEKIKAAIDQASEWAEKQADCDPNDIFENILVDTYPTPIEEGTPSGAPTFMVDSINHALSEEMERNDKIVMFGQDIAHGKGGVFTVTSGLTKKFGVKRCFNAPLAESSIAGVAIGMATKGWKPVTEIQFGDYVWTATMQIRNELAMMRYRSAGDFTCPAVIRIPVGGYIHGGCYHSQNIEATFAHWPGLVILYPSNATDAKGLLKSAIRSNDPVLFLEHKGLYRQPHAQGPEGDADYLTPIGKAKIVRFGSDATIITWGALVNKSALAAEEMEKQGYDVEVVDLRTITPLDTETIIESVSRTNRVLIAHEDVEFGGFGAEIAAQLSDTCFESLDAPIKRVGMKNVPAVPHSPEMEKAVLPQNDDVLVALQELLAY